MTYEEEGILTRKKVGTYDESGILGKKENLKASIHPAAHPQHALEHHASDHPLAYSKKKHDCD